MTKSTKWFIGIVAALFVVIVGFSLLVILLSDFSPDDTEFVTTGSGDLIAVIELRGVIVESDNIIRQLKEYRDDPSIRGILLHIESPGGGVVASQEIYHEVRKTRDQGK